MAGKKSVILHAIRTNHFPEITLILKDIWRRLRAGLPGIHFDYATNREICIMRGWSVNYPELFSFTTTHDLCDASFTRKGIERLVTKLYENEREARIEEDLEFDRLHPEQAGVPWASKRIADMTTDEYIFEFCRF